MSTQIQTCQSLECSFPSDLDLYSLDGLDFFTNNNLSFVLECPPGYYCPSFPVPWRVPPGYIVPIRVPPITGLSQDIPLRVRCCDNSFVSSKVTVRMISAPGPGGTVTGTITTSSSGATGTVQIVGSVPISVAQKAVKAIVQGVIAKMLIECAKLKAACDAEDQGRIFPPDNPRNPIPTPGSGRLRLSALSNTRGCVNGVFQANFSVLSRFSPVSFSLISGSLPLGLEIASVTPRSGKIHGTPTTGGSYSFYLLAQDPFRRQTQRLYTICIAEISPATLSDGSVGTPYSETLSTNACAVAPLSWQVSSGSLPAGLALNEETGVISGTPTTPGTYTFTILLQDEAT